MAKRTWSDANSTHVSASPTPSPKSQEHTANQLERDPDGTAVAPSRDAGQRPMPQISRKVKACTACRRAKVRCFMDDTGRPPCSRCKEKGLGCVLNKSLQTLIDERMPAVELLLDDLQMMHSGLQSALSTLNLPTLEQLRSRPGNVLPPAHATSEERNDPGPDPEEAGPTCDNSPQFTPEDDSDLSSIPIHAVYRLTKLTALRSPEDSGGNQHHGTSAREKDLIDLGVIALEDAERLFRLFIDRLDHYMYGVGAKYQSLSEVRAQSTILTIAILTIAAMHEPQGNQTYLACNQEFRRLVSVAMFERRVDKDTLRAICVASYWLNESSWVLSGLAARRAAEFNIDAYYQSLVKENSEDSADMIRLWYLVYICDQHLSTLFSRQCTTREDHVTQDWQSLLKATTATVGDARLVSQVALLTTIHSIRELFSPREISSVKVFKTQIEGFSKELDQWIETWTNKLPEYQACFGTFPRKGALLHGSFAKLYLHSHVFRGSGNAPIPPQLMNSVHEAIAAATTILNMIIHDSDVQSALVGLPCYIQSMIGFACMFLTKLVTIHGNEIVERRVVVSLISQLSSVYQATPVSKWHLVHLMASGLDRILSMLQQQCTVAPSQNNPFTQPGNGHQLFGGGDDQFPLASLDPDFMMSITGMPLAQDNGGYSNDAFGFGGYQDPSVF